MPPRAATAPAQRRKVPPAVRPMPMTNAAASLPAEDPESQASSSSVSAPRARAKVPAATKAPSKTAATTVAGKKTTKPAEKRVSKSAAKAAANIFESSDVTGTTSVEPSPPPADDRPAVKPRVRRTPKTREQAEAELVADLATGLDAVGPSNGIQEATKGFTEFAEGLREEDERDAREASPDPGDGVDRQDEEEDPHVTTHEDEAGKSGPLYDALAHFIRITDQLAQGAEGGEVDGRFRRVFADGQTLDQLIGERLRRLCSISLDSDGLHMGHTTLEVDEAGYVRVSARVLEEMIARYARYTVQNYARAWAMRVAPRMISEALGIPEE